MRASVIRVAVLSRGSGVRHRTGSRRHESSINVIKCGMIIPRRSFQSSTINASYHSTWLPLRVKMPWVDALNQSRAGASSGTKGSSSPPKPDLTPRRMSDSYYVGILLLAQDKWLSDNYLNASGHIRLGSLLMDLDALAGVIAYRHTGDVVTTVTAAVDRISLRHPLKEICDLELSGQVTYATGRSSMEVSCQVAKAPAEGEKAKPEDILLTCTFTMVSLDPETKLPVPVAPLLVETEEERQLFRKGEEKYVAKKALRNRSLLQQSPNDEESELIHAMWRTEVSYNDPMHPECQPENVINMSDTLLHSTMIMQPEDRNRHNFMIFGGFLLKQSFELAFTCAASFSHSRPIFVSLDPSTFLNPVPVGSVLYLRAIVSYTDPPVLGESAQKWDPKKSSSSSETLPRKYTQVQVRVDSKVRNVEHGEKKSTGVFNYTFLVPKEIQVMPKTYGEFMMWIDARRRAEGIDPIVEARVTENGHSGKMAKGVTE